MTSREGRTRGLSSSQAKQSARAVSAADGAHFAKWSRTRDRSREIWRRCEVETGIDGQQPRRVYFRENVLASEQSLRAKGSKVSRGTVDVCISVFGISDV
jgi:hypothetical protein